MPPAPRRDTIRYGPNCRPRKATVAVSVAVTSCMAGISRKLPAASPCPRSSSTCRCRSVSRPHATSRNARRASGSRSRAAWKMPSTVRQRSGSMAVPPLLCHNLTAYRGAAKSSSQPEAPPSLTAVLHQKHLPVFHRAHAGRIPLVVGHVLFQRAGLQRVNAFLERPCGSRNPLARGDDLRAVLSHPRRLLLVEPLADLWLAGHHQAELRAFDSREPRSFVAGHFPVAIRVHVLA